MTKLNIGIILGSTRQGRVSPQVGEWVKEIADERDDADYEIVDIADYNLPFVFTTDGSEPGIQAWLDKIDSLDGFVFIVQEYNHGVTGALKNAVDTAKDQWANKAAGFISYGSTGGARAVEQLRNVLGELKVADVRNHPTLSLFTDFENFSTFKPADIHPPSVHTTLEEVNQWSTALKNHFRSNDSN